MEQLDQSSTELPPAPPTKDPVMAIVQEVYRFKAQADARFAQRLAAFSEDLAQKHAAQLAQAEADSERRMAAFRRRAARTLDK